MKYQIIILSNQTFDFELKTNKWHVSTRLAQRGHKVVFVDPPLRFKALKTFFKNPIKNSFKTIEEKTENLIIYRPINLFNFKPFSSINTFIHTFNINRILKRQSKKEEFKKVLWIYHFDFPDLENLVERIDHDLMIYDVVDEYTAFPEYAERKSVNPTLIAWIQFLDDELKIRLNQHGLSGVKWVLHREEWLAKKSDLMFASAPGLIDKFKKWRNDVHYLPNAAATEKFDYVKTTLDEPDDIKNIPHPRVGFSGAIDSYKNDIKLIELAAEKLANYQFILIGPEKVSDPDLDLSVLKNMSNVHFLGMKPWIEMPAYFNYFDVYFIPYNLNDYTVGGCFPVKYFEALAAGLPTVVTDLPAYHGFDPDGYIAKNPDEFISFLVKAYRDDSPERQEARKQMARANSWDGKVEKQIKIINDWFNNKHE